MVPRGDTKSIIFQVVLRLFAIPLSVVVFILGGFGDSQPLSLAVSGLYFTASFFVLLSGVFGNIYLLFLAFSCSLWVFLLSKFFLPVVTNVFKWCTLLVAAWMLAVQCGCVSPFPIGPDYSHIPATARDPTNEMELGDK